MIALWMRSYRGFLFQVVFWLGLASIGWATIWNPPIADAGNHIVVNTMIDMTCFPPLPPPGGKPGIGLPPPCVLPSELDEKFVSPSPSGRAHLVIKDDDTARIKIELRGLAPNLVITAWLAYFFPPGPPPHPIFEPIDDGLPPPAGVAVPLASTRAGFTEGLGREPNQFILQGGGGAVRGQLIVDLDYNPLKPGQGPLRNELSPVTQAAVLLGSGAEQPDCCPDGLPAPRPQPVGGSYLRVFDPTTGFQLLGPDSRPTLLRSPVPAVVIAVVVHIDETTHGISAGIPIPPRPGVSVSTGDHFTLGLFDLRQFHLE